MPDELKSRILIPQGRGRRPASMLATASSPSAAAATSAASALLGSDYYSSSSLASLSAMANYQKMAALGMSPYGGLTASAMTNPLYANLLASYGLLPGVTMPKAGEDGEEKEQGEKEPTPGGSKKKVAQEDEESPTKSPSHSAAAAAALHPSFSYMYGYNPMLLNQLYAQSLAAANFSLPSSMATSFASLAQQSMPNGLGAESDEEGEGPRSESEREAPPPSHPQDRSIKHQAPQDLSMKSVGRPQDLSVKKHSRKSSPAAALGSMNSVEPEDLSVKRNHSPQDLSMKKKKPVSMSPSPAKSPVLASERNSTSSSPAKPTAAAGGEKSNRDVILRTPKVGKTGGKSKLDSIVAAISAKAEAKQQQQDGEGSSPEKGTPSKS